MWNNSNNLNESIVEGSGFIPGGVNSATNKSRINALNLLPCNVATILSLDPSRDSIIIGDVEIHQITIVGLIKSVKQTSINTSYEIDDMSGPPIDVKLWLETKDSDDLTEPANQETYPENIYVRVYGNIRSFNGKKNILAFKIIPLKDMNELTTHLLEVVYSQLKLAKFSKSNEVDPYAMLANKSTFNSTSKTMEDSMANTAFTQGYNSGLNMVAQQILKVISSCNTEEGLTISHVKNSLSSIPIEQLRKEMEFLCNEGHIYCTIDDDHYKATNNFN